MHIKLGKLTIIGIILCFVFSLNLAMAHDLIRTVRCFDATASEWKEREEPIPHTHDPKKPPTSKRQDVVYVGPLLIAFIGGLALKSPEWGLPAKFRNLGNIGDLVVEDVALTTGRNPGNEKTVGNSPFDGTRGASNDAEGDLGPQSGR